MLIAIFAMSSCAPQPKADAHIAVATNMHGAIAELKQQFEADSGFAIAVTLGSSGQIYAQITQGAPFDVFLSADQNRPYKLVEDELSQSQFTYAQGVLVMWGPKLETINLETLVTDQTRRIALANPDVAPYGLAAMEALSQFHTLSSLSEKLVYGENVGQAFALVSTGNADVGFIALSQIIGKKLPGTVISVPKTLYTPILQDAVLLKRAENNPAANAFYAYLKSEPAKDILRRRGYEVP